MMPACLSNIRILDLSRVLAGPFCTALLADLGAEVIKVESPDGDDYRHLPPFHGDTGGLFLMLNRNKKSIALDLWSEAGREVVRDLARRSDIVVENFRPGVMAGMGLDFATLSRENPRLIQVSISGFGQGNAMSANPAYDLVIQALTGFMSMSGEPDGPPMMTGESVADLATGLFASWASLAALLARQSSGLGQYVDVAMFDCLFNFLPASLAQHFYGSSPPARVGNRHPLGAPFGVFRAADRHFTIAVLNPRQFAKLAAAMGQTELANDPRFSTNQARNDNHEALKRLIEAWSTARTAEDAVAELRKQDVPCSLIRSVKEAAEDPQVGVRSLITDVVNADGRHTAVMSQPVKFSDMNVKPAAAPPRLGADGADILSSWLGMSRASIATLQRDGILRGAPNCEEEASIA